MRKHALRLAAHQPEQIGVGDDAMLDDLEQARAIFALGQRIEHGRIDEHRQRLVEASDQVFAGHQVDAGFAADGRVHLARAAWWGLESRGIPRMKIAARNPATSVRMPPPTATTTLERSPPLRDHLLGQRLHFRQAFARFAAGKEERFRFAIADCSEEGMAVKLPDVFGGNQKDLAGACWNIIA